jgi:hydrogenase nickel incorporation protein HypB
MITAALEGFDASSADVLAIENVGNLICPAEYDLGEDLRVVVFSVTEGEDKPLKYPLAFTTAHVAVISKIDLVDATAFDRGAALDNIARVHPELPVLELSARTGEGMEQWIEFLEQRIASKSALV